MSGACLCCHDVRLETQSTPPAARARRGRERTVLALCAVQARFRWHIEARSLSDVVYRLLAHHFSFSEQLHLTFRDMHVYKASALSMFDTDRDLVVLAAGELSVDGEDTLVNEGWEVRRVTPIDNPGTWTGSSAKRFPPRFWAVYTKLLIFNLTEYNTGAQRPLTPLRLCVHGQTHGVSSTSDRRWPVDNHTRLTGPCTMAAACAATLWWSVLGASGTVSVVAVFGSSAASDPLG